MKLEHPPAEPATFEEMYAMHAARVRVLVRLFGVVSAADQADVAQEVWIAAHRSLATFDPRKGTSRAWIGGIARNVAREWRRAQPRHTQLEPATLVELPETRTAELDLREAQQREALWAYFERAIPAEEQRHAFLLHVIHEMTIDEVAQVTNCQPCTVRWRVAMARRRLKAQLTEEDREKLGAILPVLSMDAFVRAMRDIKYSDAEHARVWEQVKAHVEATGGSPHARVGASSSPPAPKAYTFTGRALAGALGGVFLLGAVSGAGLHALLSAPRVVPMTAQIEADVPPKATPLSPAPQLEPARSSEPSLPTKSGIPTSTRPARVVSAPLSSSAEAEIWLLDRARKADPAEALALADRHARRFPNSTQAAAREELAIRALLDLGRSSDAEARALRLVRSAPTKRAAVEEMIGHSLF